jgi:hypothetical protein
VVAELFEQFFLAAGHGAVAALDACLGWVTRAAVYSSAQKDVSWSGCLLIVVSLRFG